MKITKADHDVLVQCIVDTARRLERSCVKEDMFGIQFVQIGTDVAAAESLRALDFDLEATYKIRVRTVKVMGINKSILIPIIRTSWLLRHSTLVMASLTRSTCSRSSLAAFVKRLRLVPRVTSPILRWRPRDRGLYKVLSGI